jgi:SAM-dependent methyltransferase
VILSCGCCIEKNPEWKITQCTFKCNFHEEYSKNQPQGEDYYKMLGALDQYGNSQTESYLKELYETVGPFPYTKRNELALEIGGGASPYIQAIKDAGYEYIGVECDPWAVKWARRTHGVKVFKEAFPKKSWVKEREKFSLILAAHSIEHMTNAPSALQEIYRLLKKKGYTYIVIPDDSDLTNPDHYWFFNCESLGRVLSTIGFKDIHFGIRQLVDREKFIYCVARK